MKKPKKKIRVGEARKLVVSIPFDIWLKLRNFQSQGRVRSIQEAVVIALEKFIKEE